MRSVDEVSAADSSIYHFDLSRADLRRGQLTTVGYMRGRIRPRALLCIDTRQAHDADGVFKSTSVTETSRALISAKRCGDASESLWRQHKWNAKENTLHDEAPLYPRK